MKESTLPASSRLGGAVISDRVVTSLLDELRTSGVGRVSPNGVLGDPTTANSVDGARALAATAGALTTAITRWSVDESGRLR